MPTPEAPPAPKGGHRPASSLATNQLPTSRRPVPILQRRGSPARVGRRVHFAEDLPPKEGFAQDKRGQVRRGCIGQGGRSPAPPRYRTRESRGGDAKGDNDNDDDGILKLRETLHCQDRFSRAQKAKLRQLEEEGAKTRIPAYMRKDGPTWGFDPTETGRGPYAGLGEAPVPLYFERQRDSPRNRPGGHH